MMFFEVINQEVVKDVAPFHHHYGVHLAVLCREEVNGSVVSKKAALLFL